MFHPTTDVILVIVVLLLFFGAKRLPVLGRDLGRGMREFKDAITGDRHEEEEADKPALGAGPARQDAPPAQPGPATAPARVPEPEHAPADTTSDPRS